MDAKEAEILVAVMIIVGLLVLFLIFFFITIIKHQKRNIQLHKEKTYAEISTLEKERKRISADLHDGLGPLLSTVKFQIKSVGATDEEDKQMVSSAGKHIDDILVKIREIANDLRPTVLVRAGFVKAIAEFASAVSLPGKSQVLCSMDPKIAFSNKDNEIHLYRATQEIVNNALKHSGSFKIEIELRSKNNNTIQLIIRDFGKGFNVQEMQRKSSGLGLRNIMSRIELIKGQMAIESAPGKGTVYLIEIQNN